MECSAEKKNDAKTSLSLQAFTDTGMECMAYCEFIARGTRRVPKSRESEVSQ